MRRLCIITIALGLLAALGALTAFSIALAEDDCPVQDLGVLPEKHALDGALGDGDCLDPFKAEDYADRYAFQLEAPADVRFTLRSDAYYSALYLRDLATGEVLSANRSIALTLAASISGRLPAGDYELIASEHSLGRQSGGYRLQLTVERPPRYVYPFSEPSYAIPNDWDLYGRYRYTRCSGRTSEILKRDAIGVRLFNPDHALWDQLSVPPELINHSYNCHAAHPQIGWSGYEGGHSGWDLQTHSAFWGLVDAPFYSLTDGEVVFVGGGYGAIVVQTDDGHTVYYQHARRFLVDMGQQVRVGTPLGIQGNAGMGHHDETHAVHVHISVREGAHAMPPPRGAVETIEPIAYFYRYLFE